MFINNFYKIIIIIDNIIYSIINKIKLEYKLNRYFLFSEYKNYQIHSKKNS